MSNQEFEQAREAARRLAERAKADPAFKEKLQKDPKGTLTSEGLPENYVDTFVKETGIGDVVGFSADTITICIAFSISL
ncbi:hypothetical protein [Tengunoibacter tsumagoiensis]|uniref:Nif11 domain-containing protein n=1 Tax=Tengunoibacter tsumagoiensis TaxID=2014871 RepID=A0A402A6J3_9CHLR|nr:hypothetical protein [Tengunoibacter tsumagoiensis]GCE14646.1 hypothetical protein KTT_45050 [Tengunoibacter tsumagoiensis]